MPIYIACLLKKTASAKLTYEEAQRIPFEAVDDADAKAKAPHLQISWHVDNSDLAVVFDVHGNPIWQLYA